MEISHYFLTLLLVTFSDISPATASYNIQDLSAVSSILHQRARRQSDQQQLECRLAVAAGTCTGGLAQARANLFVDCNLQEATSFQQGCRSNSNGDYCSAFNNFEIRNNIDSACLGSDTGECAEDCRDLLMETRSNVGCCINVVLNTTTANGFTNTAAFAFNFTLWSNCRVEPITEECLPSPITLRDSDPDVDCSTNSQTLQDETIEVLCTRSFVEPIQDALMNTGNCETSLEDLEDILRVICSVNEEGERCTMQHFVGLGEACDNDIQTCSQRCSDALSEAGCCGISLSGEEPTFFDPIYESCGLESPGACEVRLNGAIQVTPLALVNIILIHTALVAYIF